MILAKANEAQLFIGRKAAIPAAKQLNLLKLLHFV
jgi:hypothetical protein